MKKDDIDKIHPALDSSKIELPEYITRISAGFPSPADDYIDKKLDLNEFLIRHPAATFYVRVIGDSMKNAGINSGDLIIVDRALEAGSNSIVLAIINGEFTIKRFVIRDKNVFLVPENPDYSEIKVTEEMQFEVWGVVTNVIHELK